MRTGGRADVETVQRRYEELSASLAAVDDRLDAASERRERIVGDRAACNGNVLRGWQLDEELAEVDELIRALTVERQPIAAQVARADAVLAPIAKREAEVVVLHHEIAALESLVGIGDHLAAIPGIVEEARKLGRTPDGRAALRIPDMVDALVRETVSRWSNRMGPQFRTRLDDARRRLREYEAETR